MMAIPSDGDGGRRVDGWRWAKRAVVVAATNNCPSEDLLGSQAVGSATRGATLNCSGSCARVECPWAVAAAMGLAGHCARANLRQKRPEQPTCKRFSDSQLKANSIKLPPHSPLYHGLKDKQRRFPPCPPLSTMSPAGYQRWQQSRRFCQVVLTACRQKTLDRRLRRHVNVPDLLDVRTNFFY